MAVRSELEGWQRIYLAQLNQAQQEAASADPPKHIFSLPSASIISKEEQVSALARTPSDDEGSSAKKRRLSQSPTQAVRSGTPPVTATPSRRKPDGLWSAAMRFMAAQAQTFPHLKPAAAQNNQFSAQPQSRGGLAPRAWSTAATTEPAQANPPSTSARPQIPVTVVHGGGGVWTVRQDPEQSRAQQPPTAAPSGPFPTVSPPLLDQARQALAATAHPFPPGYQLQLPTLPADATFALVSTQSPCSSSLSASASGAINGGRPLAMKLQKVESQVAKDGCATTSTAAGKGPPPGLTVGLTPPGILPLTLSSPELAKLMSTPPNTGPIGIQLQSPLSAFLSDHLPQSGGGLTPDPGQSTGLLEGLIMDIATERGLPQGSAANMPVHNTTMEGTETVKPSLTAGATPLTAALEQQGILGIGALSPGLPGLMSPSLLAASLPDDF